MSTGSTLELRDLDDQHPGTSLLLAFGTSAIVRLSLDPTELPPGALSCPVAVDWKSRAGPHERLERWVGWGGVPGEIAEAKSRWRYTRNSGDITEEAAICVMAALIHDLEGGRIVSVLQIGSGGDYMINCEGRPPMQVECSGVYEDPLGYEARARLGKKRKQVLTVAAEGIASVTAFSHKAAGVYSYLHYASLGKSASATPGGGRVV